MNKNIDNINLKIVKQDKLPLKIVRTRTSVNYANVELNKGVKEVKIKYLNEQDSLPYLLTSEKEIKIFNTKNIADSIKFDLIAIDSVDKEYQIKNKFLFKKPAKKIDALKEEFKVILEPTSTKSIVNNIDYILTFNKPILKFDPSRLEILNDTLNKVPESNLIYNWNEHKNKLIISAKARGP